MTEVSFGEIKENGESLGFAGGINRNSLPYKAISGETITSYDQIPLPFRVWYDETIIRFCATEEEARVYLDREREYKGRARRL